MRLLLASCLILASSICLAQQTTESELKKNERGFYTKEAKGWFFYEDPDPEIAPEKEKPKPIPQPLAGTPSESQQEQIKLDVTWLRDNLPKMLDEAQNNPTDENIAKYTFAQRLALDMSSRFQTRAIDFMERNPILDENNRRPTTGINLIAFKGEVAEKRKKIMEKLKQVSHIWFFYKSSCDFCHRQIPILNALHTRYEIETLAVSMDGKKISNMDKFIHRVDYDLKWTQEMNVTRTPTLMLMMNDGSGFTMLTNGIETLPSIEDRLMKMALQMSVINQNEYDEAQDIMDINSLKKINGTILVDKKKMDEDPNYFVEVMKRQIELNNRQFGSNSVAEVINEN
jgi:conjugal transfer pilus assembly protein TraF